MDKLNAKHCKPCKSAEAPLSGAELTRYLQLVPQWKLTQDGKRIYRNYSMKNFQAAIDLINQVALLAETEKHHPDVHLTEYRKLQIELSTHSIDGLSENDFLMAAKIESLPENLKNQN